MEYANFYVGLDVGADTSSACIIDSHGAILKEEALPTASEHVVAFIARRARADEVAIGMESGSASILLARRLRVAGYRVHMFGTRQASKFLKIRQNKTDTNDARGIADIVRLGRGVVPEVFLKSTECQHLRSQLVLRQKLVTHRVAGEGAINAVLRLNGGRLKKSWSAVSLQRHVDAELTRLRDVEGIDLFDDVQPILAICKSTRQYLERLDRKLTKLAASSSVCSRFMEIPGVGPISALSFYSAIEDPTRFRRNEDVGAYLGLVPRTKQSGTSIKHHGITKMGNSMTRAHLAIAAGTMLRQSKEECALRTWAINATPRIGRPKARTALSRKLAVVMLAMWKSDQPFLANGRPALASKLADLSSGSDALSDAGAGPCAVSRPGSR